MAKPRVGEDQIRKSLAELADEAVQRRLWTSPDSPADFVECICELFDDSALGDALDRGERVLGPEADSYLSEIDALAKKIGGVRTPEEVINDPVMPQLRELAAKALAALDAAQGSAR